MGDEDLVVAPPGWFSDPIGRSDLRWWSGAEWTEHVAPSPAISPADIPRPGSLLPSAAPSIPLPGTFVALPADPPAYVPFGADRSGASAGTERSRSWAPIAPTRWNTGGALALGATPLIGVVTGVGIGFAVNLSLWLVPAIALLPLLWTVAAATRDRSSLDGFGYGRVPSRWWLLLGPLAYLIARTVYVRRQSGHGSAPLWWYLALSVTLGVLSVVARLLLTGLIPTA